MLNKKILLPIALLVIYSALHLFRLTALPVFADEAIYIRWSQLIIDDWQRYLFYPMNDGKTPLLMWLMIPGLLIFNDQLWAARLLSVLVGAGTVSLTYLLVRQLKLPRKTALFASLLVSITPFTFFYHRLALTDSLLLFNLLASYYFALRLAERPRWTNVLGVAVFFWLSLMSKTPALLFLPIFYLTGLLLPKPTWAKIFTHSIWLSLGLLVAGLAFYSLRIVPLFGQLFAVGGNFLQDRNDLLSSRIIDIVTYNARFFCQQLLVYLGPILLLAWPFAKTHRRTQLVLLASAGLFLLPLILLGKVIYPRYILPSSIFLIISAAVTLGSWQSKTYLRYLALFFTSAYSLFFIFTAYFQPDRLSLSATDREQFLEEWSSGHGIREASQIIIEMAQTQTVAVATEGHFGTLPDGILLYLHKQNVDNIYVEGIGQPVKSIPDFFQERAQNFERQLLIVNSHRRQLQLPAEQLLASFCRPNQAPCLEIWDLKAKNFN